jgi:hypothetical protein
MQRYVLTAALLTALTAQAQCIKPSLENYRALAATTYIQAHDEQAALMSKYCYTGSLSNRFEMGATVMVSSVQGLQMLEKQYGMNFVGRAADEFGFDMFSLKLIQNDPVDLRNESIADAKQTVKALFPNSNADSFTFAQVEAQKKPMLDYLADEYSHTFNITKNVYGNPALLYVISTNHPEYLEKALGGSHDKQAFLIRNKSNLTPLHAAFANELKGKDTKALSDKLINLVPAQMLLRADVMTYDYFLFAETFKENNPYFYGLLKAKYKFQVSQAIKPQDKKALSAMLTLNKYDTTD